MLRLVLGFTDTGLEESPAVLYCGHDGDAAEDAIANAIHPRVAVVDNLRSRDVTGWTEERAAAYAAAHPAPPVDPAPEPAPKTPSKRERELEKDKATLEALDDELLREAARAFEIEIAEPLDRPAVIAAILSKAL